MTDKKDEALKLALQALEYISSHYMSLPKIGCMALAVVEEALAEPAQQQEPVAWITKNGKGWLRWHKPEDNEKNKDSTPLYTSPPASKPWVGLTDWEREKLRSEADEADAGYTQLIKATEAKLREKNA